MAATAEADNSTPPINNSAATQDTGFLAFLAMAPTGAMAQTVVTVVMPELAAVQVLSLLITVLLQFRPSRLLEEVPVCQETAALPASVVLEPWEDWVSPLQMEQTAPMEMTVMMAIPAIAVLKTVQPATYISVPVHRYS